MSLGWEQEVTRQINAMMDLAIQEKDYASQAFLQWFVTEQIEEEATVSDIIARIRLVGERGEGLYLVDRELSDLAVRIGQSLSGNSLCRSCSSCRWRCPDAG